MCKCNSSFVPPLIYAVFGSSKNLAVGRVAACSLFIAETIEEKVSPTEDLKLYPSLVYTTTFISGLLQTAMGLLSGNGKVQKNEQIDGNKEMIALGLMNIVGSFTSCYLTTGMGTGLMISKGLALVRALLYIARPASCKLTDTKLYRNIEQYPGATGSPFMKLCSPIYFANCSYRSDSSKEVKTEELYGLKGVMSSPRVYVRIALKGKLATVKR
ncbi:unnamed protein product [Fraxinus pennsylvanica]|uniref:SLC26A/SulP transporter domain-containing protein n=1 Tax=Fraxinus pennsylvanica TaxID=56036 RepID=A0AAD2A9W7_9LAMI|nr:unnamed protein product [Fraxinus pennsylvanica]